jgi:DnaK suppressor protein
MQEGLGMEKRMLSQFQAHLQQRRSEVLRVTARVTHEGRQIMMDEPHDTGDLSIINSSKEFLFQQSSNQHQLLQLIDAALSRIKQGEFGVCANCGEEIGLARLKALPWTQFCVACQESFEKGRVA